MNINVVFTICGSATLLHVARPELSLSMINRFLIIFQECIFTIPLLSVIFALVPVFLVILLVRNKEIKMFLLP